MLTTKTDIEHRIVCRALDESIIVAAVWAGVTG